MLSQIEKKERSNSLDSNDSNFSYEDDPFSRKNQLNNDNIVFFLINTVKYFNYGKWKSYEEKILLFFNSNIQFLPEYIKSNNKIYYDLNESHHFKRYIEQIYDLNQKLEIEENFFNDFLLFIIKKNNWIFDRYIELSINLIKYLLIFLINNKNKKNQRIFNKLILNIHNILFYEYISIYIKYLIDKNELSDEYPIFIVNHNTQYNTEKYDIYNFFHILENFDNYIKINSEYIDYLSINNLFIDSSFDKDFSIEQID